MWQNPRVLAKHAEACVVRRRNAPIEDRMAIFTVRKDKRYSATIELNWVERLASNDRIARYLHEAGFTEVEVSGNGATRSATALWPHADRMGEVPPQITAIDEIEV
jgi:hypothetical protein